MTRENLIDGVLEALSMAQSLHDLTSLQFPVRSNPRVTVKFDKDQCRHGIFDGL